MLIADPGSGFSSISDHGSGSRGRITTTRVHQAARHAGTQRLKQHIHCKSTGLGSSYFVLRYHFSVLRIRAVYPGPGSKYYGSQIQIRINKGTEVFLTLKIVSKLSKK
jgi:hypothetical protein